MGFLDPIFTKALPSTAGVIARATGGSASALGSAYSTAAKYDVDRHVNEFYERVLMVFRCVDAIASAQADIPIVVREGDIYDGQIVEYPDIDRILNMQANSYENAWQWRYRYSSQVLLSPKGAFVEIIPSNASGIAEAHLLPPGVTDPIPGHVPDKDEVAAGVVQKFVDGFKVRRSDWVEDVLPEYDFRNPSKGGVIWVRAKPHPTDPYLQMTPLVAARLAAETDFFARLFNVNFLRNDGRPGLIVNIKGRLGHQDAAEIKRRFSGGYAQAGQTTVVEADGIEFVDLAANPRDVQWSELLRGSNEDIRLAFGTPESVLGNASGRTFDNADAEVEGWYAQTVMGHCNALTRPLDVLTGSITDKRKVVHDYSKVPQLQRHKQNRIRGEAEKFAGGTATLNDVLKAGGMDEMDNPGARVYYHPNGLIIAANPADAEAAAALPVIKPPAPDPAAQAAEGATTGVMDAFRRRDVAQEAQQVRERALRLVKRNPKPIEVKDVVSSESKACPYEGRRNELEGYFEGALAVWSDQQSNNVVKRLDMNNIRRGTRHWEGDSGTKALPAEKVVELEDWATDLVNTMRAKLLTAAKREANAVRLDLRDSGIDVSYKSDLLASVIDPVLDIVRTAAKNQSQRVIETIRELDADGSSLEQIKTEVQRMIGNRARWKKDLAINMTTSTIEGARNAVYGLAGNKVEKTWHSHDDERTRHTHRRADGQVRLASRPFRVGRSKMMRPGDPTAPAEETVNCRCWTEWAVRTPARLGAKEDHNHKEKEEQWH